MAAPKVDFARLAGVLFGVCFGAAVILAFGNALTKPRIDAIALEKAILARKAVLPEGTVKAEKVVNIYLAKDLEANRSELAAILDDKIEASGVLLAYQGVDGEGETTGFAFKCALPDGYSGTIKFMVGVFFDEDAGAFKIAGSKILQHAETPGLGANIEYVTYAEKQAVAQHNAKAKEFNAKPANAAAPMSVREPTPGFLKQFKGLAREAVALKKEDPPGDLDALTAATITSKAYSRAIRRVLDMCNRNQDLFLNPPSKDSADSDETQERG